MGSHCITSYIEKEEIFILTSSESLISLFDKTIFWWIINKALQVPYTQHNILLHLLSLKQRLTVISCLLSSLGIKPTKVTVSMLCIPNSSHPNFVESTPTFHGSVLSHHLAVDWQPRCQQSQVPR